MSSVQNTLKSGEPTFMRNFYQLKDCLVEKREEDFLRGLSLVAERSEFELHNLFETQDSGHTLLTLAVENNLVMAVERMLCLGADIKANSAIQHACANGYWRILEILLRLPKVDLSTNCPLVMAMRHCVTKSNSGESSNGRDYEKCCQMLINMPSIELDQKDILNRSALYYAVKHNKEELISALLDKGAYIFIESSCAESTMSHFNLKLLERHLDNCITRINANAQDKDCFVIQFDYKNLVSVSFKGKSKESPREMEPFDIISQSKKMRHLLKHPLIQSYLFVKWQRWAHLWCLYLFWYLTFGASILSYILLCYLDANAPSSVGIGLWWLSTIVAFVLILIEIVEFSLSPIAYVTSIESYFEIPLLCMVTLVLSDSTIFETESHGRTISVLIIFIILPGEILFLLGSLEIFAIHFFMLKSVLISFAKAFALYMIILVAFALCFFITLNGSTSNGQGSSRNGTTSKQNSNFNKFGTVGLSLMKVFVMLTGEYSADNINFDSSPFSYWLFLAFLILVSIVLFNLLNGLAVSDIQVD